jgi:Uma2 family endonuclease
MLLTAASAALEELEEQDDIDYPESDGKPLAENTTHYDYLTLLKSGLDCVFADRPDVFVAGDLQWYPVEGVARIHQAPDVLVAFGRPKGHRGSYLQWLEGNIPPQVVFEILSPRDEARAGKAAEKFLFYAGYGVEEYYLYDPANGELAGWLRGPSGLERIPRMEGWTSPRLGIRYELEGIELRVYGPNGERFLSDPEREAARSDADQRAQAERERAARAEQLAQAERQRAREERQRAIEAERRAQEEHARAVEVEALAARMAARLRALELDPDG